MQSLQVLPHHGGPVFCGVTYPEDGAETEAHSSEVMLVISDFRFEVNANLSDSISPSDNCVTGFFLRLIL